MGDDSCPWFGVISSTASAVGSVIKSKKMLRAGSAHQETFGGYIDGDHGGVMVRRKVSKMAQIMFNNQQRLVVALEGSGGGWCRWGAIKIDDHGGPDTSSLNLNGIVRVRGQEDQGTKIVGGITYPRVVAAGVSV